MARPRAGVTFWDRVYAYAERNGECLLFTGCLNNDGYGRINRYGKLTFIHRAVWERENGPLNGRIVCHKCDVRNCIEPSHLFAGTQKDNMADCAAKKRNQRGSVKKDSKLTEKKVADIKARIMAGATNAELGREYGTSATVMSRIRHGQRWAHV